MANKNVPTTFVSTESLNQELDVITQELNKNRITGSLTKSKILRIALAEWLDKQKRAMKILNENSELNKTGEELLRENGLL